MLQDIAGLDERAIAWDRIEQFIGYGRADAPVVFLGMEEGADNTRLIPDLLGRSISEQYGEISGQGATQRTWSRMCHLMLKREGVLHPTKAQRLSYQRERLGKHSGDTLVAELMPYPCQNATVWPEIYKQRFRTRPEYLEKMAPGRQAMLRDLFEAHPRELIVCYGKAHWSHYREIFSAAPQPGQPIEIFDWGSTRVVLAPHFVSRSFNSAEQLDAFAAAVLR